jgi:hypothetical protein
MRHVGFREYCPRYRLPVALASGWLMMGIFLPTQVHAESAQAVVVKEEPLVKVSDYYATKRLMLSDGEEIEQSIIHGPPKPPPGLVEQRQFVDRDEIERGVAKATVLSVPAFN